MEHMQKCLGEILDEENEPVNKVMAEKDVNNDITLTKISEPTSEDLGKHVYFETNLYF